MKRDLDLVRSILIYVEKADDEVDAEGLDGSPHAVTEYVGTDIGSHSEENRTQGMEFSSPHTKSVTMTLRSNLTAYRNFEQFLNEEPSDDYAAVYNKLMNDFEDYFVLASEDMLCDYYTNYCEFRDAYIEEENARNKAAAEKRAQKRESQE